MFGKVDVNGARALPLYKFLKSKLRGSLGSFVKWNYAKVPPLPLQKGGEMKILYSHLLGWQ